MNRTSSRFIVGAIVIVAMTAAACQGTAGRPASRKSLNVLVYRVGYPLIADHLRRALSHAMPGMDVVVRPSEGSALRDVEQVQSGEADVAFPLADTAYLASVGQLEGQSRRYDQIRGIAVLQLNPVLLLVRGDSDIHDIESLRRHRVGIGGVGSSTSQTARIVIRALGLDVTEVHIDGLDPSIASLAAGQVDAIFAVASYSKSIPAAIHAGARILSLSGPTVDRLRLEHPFFRRIVMPSDQYGGATVRTIALDRILICRGDLDKSTVYTITKVLFEELPTLATLDVALKDVDIEQAPSTPIALHVGAARYYREREWSR
jgi:TRAP transporter TAXI family solute receptor